MGRLVYSTGPEGPIEKRRRRCQRCGAEPCRCGPTDESSSPRPPVRVRRERSGRKGKTVTTAGPLPLSRDEAAELLGQLKRRCGSGGTLKREAPAGGPAAFRIEIQGDHVDRLLEELRARGIAAKRAGG